MRQIRLVVFDLDGTLVDSSTDLADSTNALLSDLGATPVANADVTAMVGDGAAVLVKRALAAAGLAPDTPGALERFLDHYNARLLATTKPYPGMAETLANLRASRYRLAVLTNKPVRPSMHVLEGLGLLGLFDDVIGGDTTFGRKPDPAGMLELVSRASVMPDAALLVGDSPVDLETARRAATRICLARYGFGYRFEKQDFRGDELFIDSPSELFETLKILSSTPRTSERE
jgi:phosphoglycolate phosphatase